jgi:hypothetical protein
MTTEEWWHTSCDNNYFARKVRDIFRGIEAHTVAHLGFAYGNFARIFRGAEAHTVAHLGFAYGNFARRVAEYRREKLEKPGEVCMPVLILGRLSVVQ